MGRKATTCALVLLTLGTAAAATAAWDPATGQWGKHDPNDVRVMTFNIRDHVCSTANKAEASSGWCAVARLVAALQPDVLLLQEAGDNDGNGTGSGVDSVANLNTALELFLYGGADPFNGGAVGAYVQKYAPGYDLPFVWVNSATDNFNRNVILSRFPFADRNGDGFSQRPIPATVLTDLYAWGPPTGIRGFMFAEFDLPDDVYTGDLVVGNAHLKAGGTSTDATQREREARNIAYYIDYLFNGGGTTTPDPREKILDTPAATSILEPNTPVVIGGDWNEDELTNGRKGPAEWLTRADLTGGTDGTDRDRTDSTYDASVEPYSLSRATHSNGAKYDYIAWQDSIAVLRHSFVFHSGALPAAWRPPELNGFPNGANLVSSVASDHRPVVADFILPLVPVQGPAPCPADANCDAVVSWRDIDYFIAGLNDNAAAWSALFPVPGPACAFTNLDVNADGHVTWRDIDPFIARLNTVCP